MLVVRSGNGQRVTMDCGQWQLAGRSIVLAMVHATNNKARLILFLASGTCKADQAGLIGLF